MRQLCQVVFDAGYLRASDREDTGKASGTRAANELKSRYPSKLNTS